MSELKMRPTIFLYTDAAQIDERTKMAIVAAGFLPVKVSALDAVKFLEPAIRVEGDLSAIQRAALDAIANAQGSISGTWKTDVQQHFAESLANLMLAEADAD